MKTGIYFRLVLCFAVSLLVLAGAVSFIVDPYGLYDEIVIEGFNAKKPRAYTHRRLVKQRRALRLAPTTVVFGNSRLDVGIDPDSPNWPEDLRPVFNLAIPGEGMGGIVKSYDLIVRRAVPRTIVIGVDFMDFLSADAPIADLTMPLPARLRAGHMAFQALVETHLSQTAVIDSLRTVFLQGDRYAEHMTKAGFNPMRQYLPIVRREGHYAIAHQKNRQYLKAFFGRPSSIFLEDGGDAAPMHELRVLLSDARRRGIEVHMFFYPYHADLLETIWVSGYWTMFEVWKRTVVRIVDEIFATSGRVALWDFAGYNSYSTEPIPARGDTKSDMRWYWEPGHFKSALGQLMIARLFGGGESDFGFRLSAENIEQRIADVRAARQQYTRARALDVVRIDALCEQLSCRAQSLSER